MADALKHVSVANFRRVVYFPFGFLADNAETQLEGRIALRDRPELEAWHLPCLNDDPALIKTLARQVRPDSSSDRATSVRSPEDHRVLAQLSY